MFPVLFSYGPIVIYSLSVFTLLSWAFWSFLFWRNLKNEGIDDERIFNITFYATIVSFLLARLSFVAFNWQEFFPGVLKIAALWVAPGMTFYGALIGVLGTSILISKRYKLRIALVLDAMAASLPAAGVVGALGALLDGAGVGRVASFPWTVSYVGLVGRRHPVELYVLLLFTVIAVLLYVLARSSRGRIGYRGLSGIWFTILLTAGIFLVEFMRESLVYWQGLTPNQWISMALFSEGIGALYVKGGGKIWLSVRFRRLKNGITVFIRNIYVRISGKFHRRDPQQTS